MHSYNSRDKYTFDTFKIECVQFLKVVNNQSFKCDTILESYIEIIDDEHGDNMFSSMVIIQSGQ
jgi:hypothetical protein